MVENPALGFHSDNRWSCGLEERAGRVFSQIPRTNPLVCAAGTLISIGPLVQRCLHWVPRSSLVIAHQDKHVLVSTELLQHTKMQSGHPSSSLLPSPRQPVPREYPPESSPAKKRTDFRRDEHRRETNRNKSHNHFKLH